MKVKALEVDGSLYSRLFWETTARKGILNGDYAGENYKFYHRLQFSAPHLKASLLQEKDIGEPDVADFTSLSVSCNDLGVMKSAVLGNYKLNIAQGLLIGQGRYFSKGSDPIRQCPAFLEAAPAIHIRLGIWFSSGCGNDPEA